MIDFTDANVTWATNNSKFKHDVFFRIAYTSDQPHLFKTIRKAKQFDKGLQIAISTYDVSQFMKQNDLTVAEICNLL